ncbi:O-antigen ligase family protein [Desulfolucanica intricata]|uniref:O-antigen ligase family protein n=1 Tax=Desulfolucanica intricata TaxID=1285191 RepID=UPI000834905D|nr:O-antigen ligase family protein [Desulfolucanica intricata]
MPLLVGKKNLRFRLGIVLACFYIFFSFMAHGSILNSNFHRISLYLFLAWSAFFILTKKNIAMNPYFKWYFMFICFCLFSVIYAVNSFYAMEALYSMLVVLGVTYAFSIVIKKETDFIVLFWTYSLSAFLLFIILLLSGNLHLDERLGTSLFGNANTFASRFMVAAICSMWLFLHNCNYKIRIIIFIALLTQLYALALSGGRKYFLIPFIFLYIIMLLRRDSKGKKHILKYTLVFGCVVILLFFLIFHVPIVYDAVGHRLESLYNLVTGSGYVDGSALARQHMIDYGFDLWLDKPILGYGINNFMGLYGADFGIYTYSHNNYIELLVNIGLFGFMLYYFYYMWLIRRLLIIKSDNLGLRNFFIAYICCLFIFEIGAVTYNLLIVQFFLAFSAIYISGYSNRIFSGVFK